MLDKRFISMSQGQNLSLSVEILTKKVSNSFFKGNLYL